MNKKFTSIKNIGKDLDYDEEKRVIGGKAKTNSLVLGATAIKKIRSWFRKL